MLPLRSGLDDCCFTAFYPAYHLDYNIAIVLCTPILCSGQDVLCVGRTIHDGESW